MTDEISAISGQTSEPKRMTFSLENLVDDTARNVGISQDMSNFINVAVRDLSSRPGGAVAPSGLAEGPVQQEITDFQQTFVSEGTVKPAATSLNSGVNDISDAATEMMTLLNDLTQWQMTWHVAQTAQKDLTHVMKSG